MYTSIAIVAAIVANPPTLSPQTDSLGELPAAVASFGAAVQDEWLYVLGGHVGRKHAHSTRNLSAAFVRRRVRSTGDWEALPGSFPLQSVSLVSDGARLYRVGGMTARNAPDEPEDIHSVAEVAAYDPVAQRWIDLPPLPQRRSSHDSAVIDGKLYVAGGWQLTGSPEDANWLATGCLLDLAQPTTWQALPKAPFKRRAVAVAGSSGRLFVIGGLDESAEMSRRVDILDVKSGVWSRGPDLPTHGFGMSAFAVGHNVYASGMNGTVLCLRKHGSAWQAVGKLNEKRFFHRLLARGDGSLIFLGGANRSGHLTSIEMMHVTARGYAGKVSHTK